MINKLLIKMVTIENLSFEYRKSQKKLFENFSLSIEKGKVYGLLGKNGVGKSTLLYLITGLLMPKSGKVSFNQDDVAKRYPKTLQDMYIVPEEFDLPPISFRKYVDCNKSFYPRFNMEDLAKYLQCFELNMDVNLGALSMGQKKKVYMSFALATNTTLLVMDEPTNGLDIPGKSQFRKFIASGMNDDKTIIISTHQVKDIDNLLEHVIIMDNNKVLLNETVSNICQKLLFVETPSNEVIDGALYVSPSIQGNSTILPNLENEESAINLELLFNATLTDAEKLKACFTN